MTSTDVEMGEIQENDMKQSETACSAQVMQWLENDVIAHYHIPYKKQSIILVTTFLNSMATFHR
jgi:hypothetical protein